MDNIEELENVDDASCKEIVLDSVLGMVDSPTVLFQQAFKKMRHGCHLIVTCADAYSICEAYVTSEITSQVYTDLVKDIKTHFSLENVCELLTTLDVKIIKKRLDGFEMVVEGVRP